MNAVISKGLPRVSNRRLNEQQAVRSLQWHFYGVQLLSNADGDISVRVSDLYQALAPTLTLPL
jgi:hypothetical protein